MEALVTTDDGYMEYLRGKRVRELEQAEADHLMKPLRIVETVPEGFEPIPIRDRVGTVCDWTKCANEPTWTNGRKRFCAIHAARIAAKRGRVGRMATSIKKRRKARR